MNALNLIQNAHKEVPFTRTFHKQRWT